MQHCLSRPQEKVFCPAEGGFLFTVSSGNCERNHVNPACPVEFTCDSKAYSSGVDPAKKMVIQVPFRGLSHTIRTTNGF